MIQAKFVLNWPVVSEEKIFETFYRRTTDDGRQVMAIAHTGELIKRGRKRYAIK